MTERGTARNDSIRLCMGQHAELYARDAGLRLVVDHPSNSPLIGAHAQAVLVRAAELTVGAGDGIAIVYAGRGGGALRIASAKVVRHESGAIGLTAWQTEPGFEHAATIEDGAAVHRISRLAGTLSG